MPQAVGIAVKSVLGAVFENVAVSGFIKDLLIVASATFAINAAMHKLAPAPRDPK